MDGIRYTTSQVVHNFVHQQKCYCVYPWDVIWSVATQTSPQ